MISKRIIPCLDIQNGRTVKGTNFKELRDAGDPVERAAIYARQHADELVLLDISATLEGRKTMKDIVTQVAREINIPFTVGGGIKDEYDVGELLESGADKISINSSAVLDPEIIDRLAKSFGSQCIVVAIDAAKIQNQWIVHTHGGKKQTEKKLFSWSKEAQERGAGEILFTSMDHDGTKAGFALDALSKLNSLLTIPVIASGGAGTMNDFFEAFTIGKADAALAASLFHFKELEIPELKKYLNKMGLSVRL
jgi:cyclase